MTSEDERSLGKLRHALAEQGDLEGALASVDQCIEKRPRDGLLYRERAHLHLYLGQTQRARSDFDTTERLAAEVFRTRPGRLQSNGAFDAIGVTYWMEGHRELALAFWRYTTRSLSMNRVGYAQMGGGIESGLLLWFGAVLERNEKDVELVRTFYEKRLASKHWSHNLMSWPGPIVQFFFKNADDGTLIDNAAGLHQQLCEAHFALAIRAREMGRRKAYWGHLKFAAPRKGAQEMYEFYNVIPYFLARFEIDQSGR
jgi:tetratricopeptide (TPR) repeat protein